MSLFPGAVQEEKKTVIPPPKIEVGSSVLAGPDHPQYSADKIIAKQLAGGKSGIIAALDGVGSGGEKSAKAAEFIQEELNKAGADIFTPPTINSAIATLRTVLLVASGRIKMFQQARNDPKIDSTAAIGIICESPDSKKHFLVTANVGDSRIYRYTPSQGTAEQLTRDHTLVQALVDSGQITSDEAFKSYGERNIILRAVGELRPNKKQIDFGVVEVRPGDIFLAISDGVSDNITPQGLPIAIRSEYSAAYNQSTKSVDLKKFADGLAQRAQNIMNQHSAPHAKADDACVAVLRVPRV